MSSIAVIYKPILLNGVPTGLYHEFLLYTDDNGYQEYARGGPESRINGFPDPGYGNGGRLTPFGNIYTEHGHYEPLTPDYPTSADPDPITWPYQNIIFGDGLDLSSVWSDLKQTMDDIGNGDYPYFPINQNSNSTVGETLKQNGFENPAPPDGVTAPGWNDTPRHDPDNSHAPFADGGSPLQKHDPLVLDLDGNGIGLTDVANSAAHFDYGGTGFAPKTGWVSGADGILVRDLNNDGAITADELFGAASGNGFSDLVALDSNQDARIDSGDTAFSDLKIWQDANGDGVANAGELLSLAQANISAINISPQLSGEIQNGNVIVETATFVRSDGSVASIAEVNFSTDSLYSRYIPGANFQFSTNAFYLPNLVGYGSVPNLIYSMSLDFALEGLVSDLVAQSVSMTAAQFRAAFEGLIQSWVGVENVDPSSMGSLIDARHLAVVEGFYGATFEQMNGVGVGLNAVTASNIERSYENIIDELVVRFVAQIPVSLMYNGTDVETVESSPFFSFATIQFDPNTDLVSVNFGHLLDLVVQSLPAEPAAAAEYIAMAGVVLKGLSVDLFGGDRALMASATLSDPAILGIGLDLQKALVGEFGFGAVLDETSVSGSISISYSNSVVFVGGGDKEISGGSNNVYVYSATDGNDAIFDTGGHAQLVLVGLSSATTIVQRPNGGDDLVVVNQATGATLTLTGYFTSGAFSTIAFSDEGLAIGGIIQTLRDEAVAYLISPNFASDTFVQREAQLALFGFTSVIDEGAATGTVGATNGTDVIFVGTGDKTVSGDGGTDIYVYSAAGGNDVIDDGQNLVSRLQFTDIASTDVTLSRPNGDIDLVITNTLTGKTVTVHREFANGGPLETIAFSDGVVWSYEQIKQMLLDQQSAANGGSIYGYSGLGYGSSDDTLIAGLGDKYMNGKGGADTYVYSSAGGNDVIDDGQNLMSTLQFSDIASTDVTLSRLNGGNELVITVISTGKTVTVSREFANAGPLATITFSDGVSWSYEQIKQMLLDQQSAANGGSIYGYSGLGYVSSDDTLVAGLGDKYMNGQGGADTYVYSSAGGNDVIDDGQNLMSTLQFSDIASTDVTISRLNGAAELVITVLSTGKTVTVNREFANAGPLATITFSDGVSWSYEQIKQMLLDQQSAANGGSIYGYSGLGYESSDDTLIAGLGDKYMNGQGGADTYVYSSAGGNDVIDDGQNLMSRLQFSDIVSTDVTLSRLNGAAELVITVISTGKTVTVNREFANAGPLATITFSDGVSWSYEQIKQMLLDQQSAANGGSVYGYDGLGYNTSDDTLVAGLGGKYLSGGDGNDTYVFASGGGNATIEDLSTSGADALVLTDIPVSDVSIARVGTSNDVVLTMISGDSITIKNQLGGNGTIESIQFSDGTVWTSAHVAALVGNSGSGQVPIIGTSGNDALSGTSADEIIDGGAGDDAIAGGAGSDTYLFGVGSGSDTITEYSWDSGTDTAKLIDLNVTDMTFTRSGNDLLIAINGTGETLTVLNQFNGTYGIEQVEFADGTIWDRTQIVSAAWFRGTPGDDSIAGTAADETFVGGAGNDAIAGGDGSDTFIFGVGSGNDTITEYSWDSGTDTAKLTGLNVADVTFTRSGNDLLVAINSTGETLTVLNQFNGTYGIEQVQFADGTIWDRTQIASAAWYRGTSGDDSISGTAGDEIFDGGAGNDAVAGGAGSDTYIFGVGSGNDTVTEYSWDNGTDTAKLIGLNAADVTFTRSGNDLIIAINSTNETLTAINQFTGYGFEQVQFADGTIWDAATIAANAVVVGTSGDDSITLATDGATVIPGLGNDTLSVSGAGADTIIFAKGDGHDTLTNPGSGYVRSDVLHLIDSLPSDVELSRSGNAMTLKILSTGDTFTASFQFWGDAASQGLGQIKFSDGTTWDRALIWENAWIRGTTGNDSIELPTDGVTVDAGLGDDYISVSGTGSDTIIFAQGDGHDTLNNSGAGYVRTDTLSLIDSLASDIQLSRSGNALTLTQTTTGDTFHINYQFWGDLSQGVSQIKFSDNTTWDRDAIAQHSWISGTSGNDTLNGGAGIEAYDGGAGNDTINGGGGDDALMGGAGDDTLTGGSGNDILVFKSGFGHDVITDFVAGAGTDDVIEFHDGIFADFNAVVAAASTSGNDTVITVDVDNSIVLQNVALANLHQDDFRFN